MTSHILPGIRFQLGLRQRLWFALGVLALLVIVLAVAALLAVRSIRAAAHEAVAVDGMLSRLASDVAIKAQAARRYDQSYFLHVDRPDERATYLQAWEQAAGRLEQAIAAFAAAAREEPDRRQARLWQAAFDLYGEGFRSVVAAVETGVINTPRQADIQFSTYQQNIETLGDLSVGFAARKAAKASATASTLDTTVRLVNLGLGLTGTIAVILALAWCVLLPGGLMRPIVNLTGVANRLATGDLAARTRLTGADELGVLGRTFDLMAGTIQQRTAELEAQFAAAEAARHEAELARAHVLEQLATIEAQRVAIREMSVPILPVSDRVLVMPLVGALDSGRIVEAQERALQAIDRWHAAHLILDVTGVPLIDTQVARGLVGIIRSANLLGAQALLVGIRPEVAQTMVGLGIDLATIVTFSTLQCGIEYTATASSSLQRKGSPQ